MDLELGERVSTAAATVVNTLATTAWEQTTKAMGALWRRVHPDRAETIESELNEAHEQLVAARASGDGGAEEDLIAAWRSRLRGLLATDPSLADDLRRVVERLGSAAAEGRQFDVGHVEMHAAVSDYGRVYQALGDQHITEW